MLIRALILIAFILQAPLASAGIFGNNAIDDTFAVKSVEGNKAVLDGKPKNLKVGDYLYFNRSPFRFKVSAIEGDKVTVTLSSSNDLKVGNALIRNPNDQIKKSIDTESRLKKALED